MRSAVDQCVRFNSCVCHLAPHTEQKEEKKTKNESKKKFSCMRLFDPFSNQIIEKMTIDILFRLIPMGNITSSKLSGHKNEQKKII